MSSEDGLFQMDLNLHPNEASGLLTIEDEGLLRAHGWDLGFWAVLDEGGSKTASPPSTIVAAHLRCTLPTDAHSGTLEAEFVRVFPILPRIEGLAMTTKSRAFYVTDEDEGVHLRLTRLLAGQSTG